MPTILDPDGDPLLDPDGDPITVGADAYIDPFTGADGTSLVGTLAPNGAVYEGNAAWTIQGNQLSGGGAVYYQYLVADWGNPDVTVAVTIGDAEAPNHGLVLRLVDSANFVWCVVNGSDLRLQRFVTGSATTLGSWTITPADDKTVSVTMAGADYTVTFDGTEMGTVTDPGGYYLTETRHGVITYSWLTVFDDLTVSGAPEPVPPVSPAIEAAHLLVHGGTCDVAVPPTLVAAHLVAHGGEVTIAVAVATLATTGGAGRYPIGAR